MTPKRAIYPLEAVKEVVSSLTLASHLSVLSRGFLSGKQESFESAHLKEEIAAPLCSRLRSKT